MCNGNCEGCQKEAPEMEPSAELTPFAIKIHELESALQQGLMACNSEEDAIVFIDKVLDALPEVEENDCCEEEANEA